MNIRDALYHAVHDYKGGVNELAVRMGIAGSTLQNMANPRAEGHEWTLKRIKQVIDFTGDQRVVHAFCAEFGGLFVPTAVEGVDGDVFRQVTAVAAEFGDVVREVQASVADGRVSANEAQRVSQAAFELMRAVFRLDQQVGSMAAMPASKGALKVV